MSRLKRIVIEFDDETLVITNVNGKLVLQVKWPSGAVVSERRLTEHEEEAVLEAIMSLKKR